MVVQCSHIFANIKHSITVNEHLFDVSGDSSKYEKRLCLAGLAVKLFPFMSELGSLNSQDMFLPFQVDFNNLSYEVRQREPPGGSHGSFIPLRRF